MSAAAGFKTIVLEVNDGVLQKGLGRIDKFLTDGVAKGKVAAEDRDKTLANLNGHDVVRRSEGLRSRDRGDRRERRGQEAGLRAGRSARRPALPDRVEHLVAVHHRACRGNQAPGQVRRAALLQPGAADEARRSDPCADDERGDATRRCSPLRRRSGKEPITAPDNGGFIVNRLLVPYLLDAIRCVEEGLGTVEDIDKGMKLGCGHPMGPLTLLDFVGLDTTYYIANIMFDEFRETRFAPPPLLKRMVLAGHLGRKSGKGFYDYSK